MEMEQKKVVAFLRERKQGAGQHETHVRTVDRLADRLRIVGIVFLGIQIGLDELRSHQTEPHVPRLAAREPISEHPVASMPIKHGVWCRKNSVTWDRRSRLRRTVSPNDSRRGVGTIEACLGYGEKPELFSPSKDDNPSSKC